MDPEDQKQLEDWVAEQDAKYAAQGFPEDRRRKWAEFNRQKYSAHLSRPKQPVTPDEPQRPTQMTPDPINPGPRPEYLMGLMSTMGLDEAQAQALARKLYSGHPAGAQVFSVPNGPRGWNYEEPAVPEMIPNANGPATSYPPPAGVPSPTGAPSNFLAMPDDPEQRRAWLELISGGGA